MDKERPEGWATIKRRNCNEKLNQSGGAKCGTCPAKPQTCNVDFEAGADALIELGYHKHDTDGELREKIICELEVYTCAFIAYTDWDIDKDVFSLYVHGFPDQILSLISKPPAPVLSDGEIMMKIRSHNEARVKPSRTELTLLKAQRDSDHKYYGGGK